MEHETSDRGFKHLTPVPGAYGGHVRVYESSAAMHPHIWVAIEEPNDLNAWARGDKSGGLKEAHSHLRIEDAKALAEQLLWLVSNHYQVDAPDPERMKGQLISVISAVSEDRWAAGWMSGIEVELWEQGGIWRVLGEAIGAWPTRSKESDYDVVWVPLSEWVAAHP